MLPPNPRRRPAAAALGLLATVTAAAAAVAGLVGGCVDDAAKTRPTYSTLGKRDVPAYLTDSVYEYSDMSGREAFPVSGYGLVANLRGTGGCRAPTAVRDYMVKELGRHHFGSLDGPAASPDKVLASKNFSIVRVEGYIPPGARAGADYSTWFDVRVSALAESEATSLAHGTLFECDLKIGGANPLDPGNGNVSVKGQATGSVFVNPTYVSDTTTDTPAARSGRLNGYVLAGARAMEDRPLILRLRAPERRTARAIERRINERFADVADDDLQAHGNTAAKNVANAQDEAMIYVYVPRCYGDHWEHFAGVVNALFLRGGDPGFAATRARELAEAAVLPKAPLQDISYAWEGLGKPALFALDPLLTDRRPDVQYAAARAAAFIGDRGAVPVLLDIAQAKGNPFRVNAVQVLGELPPTPRTDALCRGLLDSDEATVRVAAYQLLCKHGDPSIYTRWVRDGGKEIFALDVVRCGHAAGGGPPLIYATQQGVPRVAIFGTDTTVDLPMIMGALEDDRLMFSSTPDGGQLTVSYRSPYRRDLVGFTCGADLPELIAHLGGDGSTADSTAALHLSYADVVAVLQSLVKNQKVSGPAPLGGDLVAINADAGAPLPGAPLPGAGGPRAPATFILGSPSSVVRLPVSGTSILRAQSGAGRPTGNTSADTAAGRDAGPAAGDNVLRQPSTTPPPAAVPLVPLTPEVTSPAANPQSSPPADVPIDGVPAAQGPAPQVPLADIPLADK